MNVDFLKAMPAATDNRVLEVNTQKLRTSQALKTLYDNDGGGKQRRGIYVAMDFRKRGRFYLKTACNGG